MEDMKKEFTLIEFLAVIVILSVITLITVPMVMNVIEDSKKKAAVESVNGILDAADKYLIGATGLLTVARSPFNNQTALTAFGIVDVTSETDIKATIFADGIAKTAYLSAYAIKIKSQYRLKENFIKNKKQKHFFNSWTYTLLNKKQEEYMDKDILVPIIALVSQKEKIL